MVLDDTKKNVANTIMKTVLNERGNKKVILLAKDNCYYLEFMKDNIVCKTQEINVEQANMLLDVSIILC